MPRLVFDLAITMDAPPSLTLSVPILALERPRPAWRIRQLTQWAQELPIGNVTLASHQMLEKLKTLNRSRYPCKDRLQLHNSLRPVFEALVQAIRQPLRQADLPLDRKLQYTADLIQQLLEEMASGYKLVVTELAMDPSLREHNQMLLQEAGYLAIRYLSQRLVEAYSLYADEPAHVWGDLNQLYGYAEARHFHTRSVDDPYPDTPLPITQNIDYAYKRILLLSLAEPYHLMQYEADDVYRMVASFSEACGIEPFSQLVTQGEYLVDLDSDERPFFLNRDIEGDTKKLRLIDISAVKQQLNLHLQRLLRSNIYHAELEAVSLVERQQRDMLLRLADAWNASLIRKTQRFNLEAKVELTSGLNASHYFVSGQASFTPEIDALRLAHELDTIDDAMHTIFASAYREALQKDRRHGNRNYALNPWWQRNISPIGIALNAQEAGQELDVRVGELVVYRLIGKQRQRWQVGVIRWLKNGYSSESPATVNIGIMNLAHGAMPVGTKAVKGLGTGTDYFRSLLIPKQVSLQQTRSLVVPAFLYDVGTILVMNLKQRLTHVRLTRVLLSTRSFTQFEFEVTRKPVDFIF
ncbi:MAG: hypothetical protein GC149_14775 [Gammaproteobacteria bacterium]|nr:hypothetical protein [Gammaproteobacteria bacterium]